MPKEPVEPPAHVHDASCTAVEEHAVLRCEECGLLFESGISDPGMSGRERCPQCGLQNASLVADPDEKAFVIRHSSRFR